MKFYFDRIEDECAVIYLDDNSSFTIPKNIIPKDIREGNYITINVSLDEEENKKMASEIEELYNL